MSLLDNPQLYEHDSLGKPELRTTAKGTFTPSGLQTAMRTTKMTVGDTPTALPPVALAGRNTLSILNKSSSVTVYVDGPGVSTDSWEIPPNTFFNLDVKDGIDVYAVCGAGESALIKVLELA